jgi:putative acetyltransferase
MESVIRPEQPEDRSHIFKIHESAFNQDNESRLVDALRKGKTWIPELSLVAEINGKVAGHVLFSKISIGRTPSLALAPVGVAPGYQGRGLGDRLIRAGLEKAREMGFGSVIVLGHPEYYPRFGFEPASKWGLECPFTIPDDAFMALELKPGALSRVKGTVRYPAPFKDI